MTSRRLGVLRDGGRDLDQVGEEDRREDDPSPPFAHRRWSATHSAWLGPAVTGSSSMTFNLPTRGRSRPWRCRAGRRGRRARRAPASRRRSRSRPARRPAGAAEGGLAGLDEPVGGDELDDVDEARPVAIGPQAPPKSAKSAVSPPTAGPSESGFKQVAEHDADHREGDQPDEDEPDHRHPLPGVEPDAERRPARKRTTMVRSAIR